MKDTTKDWIVKINKDTSWSVINKVTKEQKKIWSKRDVEDFLDCVENQAGQTKRRSSR